MLLIFDGHMFSPTLVIKQITNSKFVKSFRLPSRIWSESDYWNNGHSNKTWFLKNAYWHIIVGWDSYRQLRYHHWVYIWCIVNLNVKGISTPLDPYCSPKYGPIYYHGKQLWVLNQASTQKSFILCCSCINHASIIC